MYYYPKRLIFTLADGRDIWDVHNGEYVLWDEEDINALLENMQRYGHPYFTSDLEHYDVNYESLHKRFPHDKLIEVKGVQFRNKMGRPHVEKKR